MAAVFAEGLASAEGAVLAGVASRSEARAAAFAEQHRVSRAHPSYEALAADPSIDVVYVATPNAQHAEHAEMALEAGRAVLCEKPFTLDAREARRVVDTARRRKVFCMEAMWTRFAPAVRQALSEIEAGAIGELTMAHFDLGMPFVFDEHQRLFRPELGGGALLDLGVYPLAFASRLFGAPSEVRAQAVFGPTGVDEQVSALLQYPGGRQAMIAASLRNAMANEGVIMGRRGLLTLHAPLYFPTSFTRREIPVHGPPRFAPGGRLSRLRQSAPLQAVAARLRRFQGTLVVPRLSGNGYNYEADAVMACLREGRLEHPLMPLDESIRILETADAIRHQIAKAG
jgi:predicted dehydrogenase